MQRKPATAIIIIIAGIGLMFSYFLYQRTNTETLVKSRMYGGDGISTGGSFYAFSLKKGDVIAFGDLIGPANFTIRIRINQFLEWKMEKTLNFVTDFRGGFEFIAPQDAAYELRIDNIGYAQEYFSVRLVTYEKYALLLYGGTLLTIVGLVIAAAIFIRNRWTLKRIQPAPPP